MSNEEAFQVMENGGRVSLGGAQRRVDQEVSLNEAQELLERRDALMSELDSTPEKLSAGISEERFAKLIEAQRLDHLAREERRHSLKRQESARALRLNQALYAAEPENTFTIMTDDPE